MDRAGQIKISTRAHLLARLGVGGITLLVGPAPRGLRAFPSPVSDRLHMPNGTPPAPTGLTRPGKVYSRVGMSRSTSGGCTHSWWSLGGDRQRATAELHGPYCIPGVRRFAICRTGHRCPRGFAGTTRLLIRPRSHRLGGRHSPVFFLESLHIDGLYIAHAAVCCACSTRSPMRWKTWTAPRRKRRRATLWLRRLWV